MREISVVPDLVLGLQLADGSRLNFMVEVDRGTMPVRRSDPEPTSFEGKMRVYLAAHIAKQHDRQFGWKNFRTLVITTNRQRLLAMAQALLEIPTLHNVGPAQFLFASFEDLRETDPLNLHWMNGHRLAAPIL